ncbi:hypothetical protein DBB_11520 [Desulfoluna spongiiphila]|nr:hypothetical protein DBB_11520 [Desulfoluna spongiiphila]
MVSSDESQDQEDSVKNNASGGEVCHLESWLRMRFPLRSSGKITFAIDSD